MHENGAFLDKTGFKTGQTSDFQIWTDSCMDPRLLGAHDVSSGRTQKSSPSWARLLCPIRTNDGGASCPDLNLKGVGGHSHKCLKSHRKRNFVWPKVGAIFFSANKGCSANLCKMFCSNLEQNKFLFCQHCVALFVDSLGASATQTACSHIWWIRSIAHAGSRTSLSMTAKERSSAFSAITVPAQKLFTAVGPDSNFNWKVSWARNPVGNTFLWVNLPSVVQTGGPVFWGHSIGSVV